MTVILGGKLTIVDFNKNSTLNNWRVIDDVVMGGQSKSGITINKEGHAVFSGAVSVANNGGFSSVRNRFEKIKTSKYKKIKIRLKGDGNNYQFRVKPSMFSQYAYTVNFLTNTNWETIQIKMGELTPTFRGRFLDMDNFDGAELEELGFLIGNKKNENFKLIIDSIILE